MLPSECLWSKPFGTADGPGLLELPCCAGPGQWGGGGIPRVSGMRSGEIPRATGHHARSNSAKKSTMAHTEDVRRWRGPGPCMASPRQVGAGCCRAPTARRVGPVLSTLAPWVGRPLRAFHGPGRGATATAHVKKPGSLPALPI